MTTPAISGTMIRDVLLCERRAALDMHGDPAGRDTVSPFVRMLWRDGLAHEDAILATLPGAVIDLRPLGRAERQIATRREIANGAATILGAVISYGDMVGMPDVLRASPSGHYACDVKSGAATEGPNATYKAEYLVQVAHYAHILEMAGLGRGDVAAVIGRNGEETPYDLSRRLGRSGEDGRGMHARLLEHARRIRSADVETRGALSARCGMCEWRTRCRQELTASDDLSLICGLGRAVREPIETVAGSIRELAAADDEALRALPGVGVERLHRFAARARLFADPEAGPTVRAPLAIANPDHAVDFDVEADPVRGLVYLHGFWHVRRGRQAEFVHFFAETADAEGERDAFARAMEHFHTHHAAHWFHYSAYEKTAYRALQRRHPDVCDEADIDHIFAPTRCTDIYGVIAARTDWPLSSYGIKSIAKACGFSWSDTDPGGAASIEWYDRYVTNQDAALRKRIVTYNRDDVRASAHVREALAELEATGRIDGFKRPGL